VQEQRDELKVGKKKTKGRKKIGLKE